jgi:hypothetical protein
VADVNCPWSLLSVLWEDAFDGENGWTEVKSYRPEAALVVTVGYAWPGCLPGYITLVNSYFPDEVDDLNTVGMPVHIPLGMVKKITILDQPNYDTKDLQ